MSVVDGLGWIVVGAQMKQVVADILREGGFVV